MKSIQIQDSLITMIFGVGAAVAAFPPVMDFCGSKLGRKGAVLFGGLVFCLGAALQAFAPEPKDGWMDGWMGRLRYQVGQVGRKLPSSNLTELWKMSIYSGFSHEKW